MIDNIPLYHFFNLLRNHKHFDLGLGEYFILIEVLQKEPAYLDDAQDLLNLCRLLWLKPGQSENLFVNLFQQSFDYLKDLPKEIDRPQESKEKEDTRPENKNEEREEQEDLARKEEPEKEPY